MRSREMDGRLRGRTPRNCRWARAAARAVLPNGTLTARGLARVLAFLETRRSFSTTRYHYADAFGTGCLDVRRDFGLGDRTGQAEICRAAPRHVADRCGHFHGRRRKSA